MMHAYDRVYLDKARTALGRMFDFAVHDLKYTLEEYFHMFLSSDIATRFADGDFQVLVGKSGVELAYEVCEEQGKDVRDIKPQYKFERSEEYWTGWALAYYQWETAMPFVEILEYMPIDDIIRMYSPYHEMDIRHFCDRMNELYRAANPETKLKKIRQRAGLSQSELAEMSGVPVRTIQQYEQRQKSINKAQAEYLMMLARALHCNAEDLIEPVE